ncbi:MAG: glucose-6-phosphate dehydrogenase assembly protein OpcA [Verrucomicrobia bacterium]|nr:glucose-6-phosphate dehydrogenase assembly protein OpcA [Verrucomicrobiota bacterium]
MTTDNTTVEQFLSGIPVPVEPAAIERELAALWKPASEQAGADGGAAVTRVCLANLLVVGDTANNAWHADTLQRVSARFPCRILWAQLGPAGADAALTAAVTALCHLPSPGNPQVCSELITLRTGRGGAGNVPGAVLPLLEPDLPVVLWWALPTDAEQLKVGRDSVEPASEKRRLDGVSPHLDTTPSSTASALFDTLSELADRVIVHAEPLANPALRTLRAVPSLRLCLRECAADKATVMVWHTMGHWREMTAQFFDPPQLRDGLDGIETVTVRYATPDGRPTAALPAALYAGWIAGQLQWTPIAREVTPEGVRATFAAGPRRVTVELLAQAAGSLAPGRLTSVDIAAEFGPARATFHLARVCGERTEIRQTFCLSEACTLLKSLPIVERDEATLLGAAIESQSAASVFPRAAKTALWLLGETS